MSVQVLRNDKPYLYKKASISYSNGGNGRFGIELPIQAELAEYDFIVYAVKTPDSVLMVHRKNIVAGDVFFLVANQILTMAPNIMEFIKENSRGALAIFLII